MLNDTDLSDSMQKQFKSFSKNLQFNLSDLKKEAQPQEMVLRYLPHREPFLFIENIHTVDTVDNTILCSFALSEDDLLVSGHFPGQPILPGVIQIEAGGQAGTYLQLMQDGDEDAIPVMTHILAAKFIKSIVPPAKIAIYARLYCDGLFFIILSQCVVDGTICSAACIKGTI